MKTVDPKFVKIDQNNLEIFKNLAQAYEAEFSNLTHKIPNELGLSLKMHAGELLPVSDFWQCQVKNEWG